LGGFLAHPASPIRAAVASNVAVLFMGALLLLIVML